jgi:hypothetical protein
MNYSIPLVCFNLVEDIGNRLVMSIHSISIDSNVRVYSGSYKITNKIPKNLAPTEFVLVLPPFLASKLTSQLVSIKAMSPLLPHQDKISWISRKHGLGVSKMVGNHCRCCSSNRSSRSSRASNDTSCRSYHHSPDVLIVHAIVPLLHHSTVLRALVSRSCNAIDSRRSLEAAPDTPPPASIAIASSLDTGVRDTFSLSPETTTSQSSTGLTPSWSRLGSTPYADITLSLINNGTR